MKIALTFAFLIAAMGCASSPEKSPTDPDISAALREIDAKRIESNIRALASFGTRHTLSEQASDTRGIGASARWIQSQFDDFARASGGRLLVEVQSTRVARGADRVARDVDVVNLIAILPGRSSLTERCYVVSGHYDSRALEANDATSDAPGANDDASGTAVVMELARVMSRHQFDATLVFACVAGEEQGLLGASALAERAKNEGWNIEGMITNDIVGNTLGGNGVRDRTRVRVFSEGVPTVESAMQVQNRQSVGGENDGESRQFARAIDEIADRYPCDIDVTLIFRRDRYGRGGDHIPFLRQGFPAVRFTEPNEDFSRQHQNVTERDGRPYGDLPEFVDFGYVASVARLNCAVLADLARAPAPPINVAIDPMPSYDSTLSWSAGAGGAPAGYTVLIRDTTAQTWQKRIDVGDVTTYTLAGFNKDDWLFGVQCHDAQGHASIAVSPVPRRQPRRGPTTR